MRSSASRIKSELHPAENNLPGGLAHFARTFFANRLTASDGLACFLASSGGHLHAKAWEC